MNIFLFSVEAKEEENIDDISSFLIKDSINPSLNPTLNSVKSANKKFSNSSCQTTPEKRDNPAQSVDSIGKSSDFSAYDNEKITANADLNLKTKFISSSENSVTEINELSNNILLPNLKKSFNQHDALPCLYLSPSVSSCTKVSLAAPTLLPLQNIPVNSNLSCMAVVTSLPCSSSKRKIDLTSVLNKKPKLGQHQPEIDALNSNETILVQPVPSSNQIITGEKKSLATYLSSSPLKEIRLQVLNDPSICSNFRSSNVSSATNNVILHPPVIKIEQDKAKILLKPLKKSTVVPKLRPIAPKLFPSFSTQRFVSIPLKNVASNSNNVFTATDIGHQRISEPSVSLIKPDLFQKQSEPVRMANAVNLAVVCQPREKLSTSLASYNPSVTTSGKITSFSNIVTSVSIPAMSVSSRDKSQNKDFYMTLATQTETKCTSKNSLTFSKCSAASTSTSVLKSSICDNIHHCFKANDKRGMIPTSVSNSSSSNIVKTKIIKVGNTLSNFPKNNTDAGQDKLIEKSTLNSELNTISVKKGKESGSVFDSSNCITISTSNAHVCNVSDKQERGTQMNNLNNYSISILCMSSDATETAAAVDDIDIQRIKNSNPVKSPNITITAMTPHSNSSLGPHLYTVASSSECIVSSSSTCQNIGMKEVASQSASPEFKNLSSDCDNFCIYSLAMSKPVTKDPAISDLPTTQAVSSSSSDSNIIKNTSFSSNHSDVCISEISASNSYEAATDESFVIRDELIPSATTSDEPSLTLVMNSIGNCNFSSQSAISSNLNTTLKNSSNAVNPKPVYIPISSSVLGSINVSSDNIISKTVLTPISSAVSGPSCESISKISSECYQLNSLGSSSSSTSLPSVSSFQQSPVLCESKTNTCSSESYSQSTSTVPSIIPFPIGKIPSVASVDNSKVISSSTSSTPFLKVPSSSQSKKPIFSSSDNFSATNLSTICLPNSVFSTNVGGSHSISSLVSSVPVYSTVSLLGSRPIFSVPSLSSNQMFSSSITLPSSVSLYSPLTPFSLSSVLPSSSILSTTVSNSSLVTSSMAVSSSQLVIPPSSIPTFSASNIFSQIIPSKPSDVASQNQFSLSTSSNLSSPTVSSTQCLPTYSFPVPSIISVSSMAQTPVVYSSAMKSMTSVNRHCATSKQLHSMTKSACSVPAQSVSFSSEATTCSSSFKTPEFVLYTQSSDSQVAAISSSQAKSHSMCDIVNAKDSSSNVNLTQSAITPTFPLVSYISCSSNVSSIVSASSIDTLPCLDKTVLFSSRPASSYKSVHEMTSSKPLESLSKNMCSSTAIPPSSAYSSLLLPPSSKLSFLASSSTAAFDSNCSAVVAKTSFLSSPSIYSLATPRFAAFASLSNSAPTSFSFSLSSQPETSYTSSVISKGTSSITVSSNICSSTNPVSSSSGRKFASAYISSSSETRNSNESSKLSLGVNLPNSSSISVCSSSIESIVRSGSGSIAASKYQCSSDSHSNALQSVPLLSINSSLASTGVTSMPSSNISDASYGKMVPDLKLKDSHVQRNSTSLSYSPSLLLSSAGFYIPEVSQHIPGSVALFSQENNNSESILKKQTTIGIQSDKNRKGEVNHKYSISENANIASTSKPMLINESIFPKIDISGSKELHLKNLVHSHIYSADENSKNLQLSSQNTVLYENKSSKPVESSSSVTECPFSVLNSSKPLVTSSQSSNVATTNSSQKPPLSSSSLTFDKKKSVNFSVNTSNGVSSQTSCHPNTPANSNEGKNHSEVQCKILAKEKPSTQTTLSSHAYSSGSLTVILGDKNSVSSTKSNICQSNSVSVPCSSSSSVSSVGLSATPLKTSTVTSGNIMITESESLLKKGSNQNGGHSSSSDVYLGVSCESSNNSVLNPNSVFSTTSYVSCASSDNNNKFLGPLLPGKTCFPLPSSTDSTKYLPDSKPLEYNNAIPHCSHISYDFSSLACNFSSDYESSQQDNCSKVQHNTTNKNTSMIRSLSSQNQQINKSQLSPLHHKPHNAVHQTSISSQIHYQANNVNHALSDSSNETIHSQNMIQKQPMHLEQQGLHNNQVMSQHYFPGSYLQPSDYSGPVYNKRASALSPRGDSRQCYSSVYKHNQQYQQIEDQQNMVDLSNINNYLLEGTGNDDREVQTDHSRYFSVSHLVSQGPPRKQAQHTKEEKKIEKGGKSSAVKKTENKLRSKGNPMPDNRRRSPARLVNPQQSMWNGNKSSMGQTQKHHNYTAEALLSNQNYTRGMASSQTVNQNYPIMAPQNAYQYPHQVKHFTQNANIPFGYSSSTNNIDGCSSDYNFQLHQPGTGLGYASNMPYMAHSYPYQSSNSSAMLPSDLMAGTHAPPPYPRFHDFSDQNSFTSNPSFPFPFEPQEMCPTNGGNIQYQTSSHMVDNSSLIGSQRETGGPVPFSPLRSMDRQHGGSGGTSSNMLASGHLSTSSLSNFNLTSIIPEIDGKVSDS